MSTWHKARGSWVRAPREEHVISIGCLGAMAFARRPRATPAPFGRAVSVVTLEPAREEPDATQFPRTPPDNSADAGGAIKGQTSDWRTSARGSHSSHAAYLRAHWRHQKKW